jgi:Raf kinase inhibitor-like YbhB/YbcL family protein
MRRRGLLASALVLAVALSACAHGPQAKIPIINIPSTITVTSPAFDNDGALPADATCTGSGAFPPILWDHLPDGTAAVAVIVYDRNGTDGIFVHRIITDLDPASGGLRSAQTPPNAVEYATSTGKPGWTPPCPPSGSGAHHYVFWVLALDRLTRVPTSAVTATAIATITEAAFAQGEITGTATG